MSDEDFAFFRELARQTLTLLEEQARANPARRAGGAEETRSPKGRFVYGATVTCGVVQCDHRARVGTYSPFEPATEARNRGWVRASDGVWICPDCAPVLKARGQLG